MPFIAPPKKPKGYGPQDEEPNALRPRAGAVGVDAPGAAQPQGQTSVPGSQHINIGDYLRANEGQGAKMADKLAGGLDAKAAPIAGAVGPLKAVAPGQGPAGVLDMGAGQGAAATAAMTPPGHTPAPAPLRGQAELDRANEVTADAKLLGTDGGRQELLDKAYGSGRTGGEAAFDNALMGGGAGGRLAELSKKYSGLAERVSGSQAWSKQADEGNAAIADDARRLGESKAAIKAREDAEAAELERTRPAREAAAAAEAERKRLQKDQGSEWTPDDYDGIHTRWLKDALPPGFTEPAWMEYIYNNMTQDEVNAIKSKPIGERKAFIQQLLGRIGAPDGRVNVSQQAAAGPDYSTNPYA